jgi:hypothetical protein
VCLNQRPLLLSSGRRAARVARSIVTGLFAGAAVVVMAVPAVGRASGWLVVPSPNAGSASSDNFLLAVSCASARACTAVGDYYNSSDVARTLAESWNGRTWSVVPSPNAGPASSGNDLDGVSCVTATACTAVGDYKSSGIAGIEKTLAELWNGTHWSVVHTPDAGPASSDNHLASVSCASATACTAVGFYDNNSGVVKTLIESWNGTRWSVVRSPSAGPAADLSTLAGVSCVSATACTAAGWYGNNTIEKTLIESWNGTRWSVVHSPNVGASRVNNFYGVSCVSAKACTAAGGYATSKGTEKTLIESWNGTRWSVVPSPNAGPVSSGNVLNGLSCAPAATCTVAGYYTTSRGAAKTLIESWNRTRWSVVPSPNPGPALGPDELDGVSCLAATGCTAAGWYANSSNVTKTLIESHK